MTTRLAFIGMQGRIETIAIMTAVTFSDWHGLCSAL